MTEEACSFTMWVRPEPEDTFALKFNVSEGRGVFRVSRPGILVDPPATTEGEVTGLSLADLHATRFLLIPRRGGRRNFLFSDLSGRHFQVMQPNSWNPVEAEIIDGQRSFLPPTLSDEDETITQTASIPIEAMRPSFQPGTDEETRLREEVRHLTLQLTEEREKARRLEQMVTLLDQQLRQVRDTAGDDELF